MAAIVEVGSVDDASTAMRSLEADVVPVAVGGDGTVNLMARAVVDLFPRRPMAVLPFGTGNAFAHSLGVGRIRDALAALESGRILSIDVMRTSDPRAPLALVSISVGFEAELVRQIARVRHLTPLVAGLLAAPKALARHRGATISLDGTSVLSPRDSIYSAGLYALPCYAFGLRAFRDSQPCDGSAEAYVSTESGSYWLDLVRGRERALPWRCATLETSHAVQFDGEYLSGAAMDVYLEPAGLQVLVPHRVAATHSGPETAA